MNTCGVLVLLAVFRAVDYISCDKPYKVVANKWSCSTTDKALALYRKEIIHLLDDVEDTEDPAARSIFPRPGKERRFAGYPYFRRCLMPALMNIDNSDY